MKLGWEKVKNTIWLKLAVILCVFIIGICIGNFLHLHTSDKTLITLVREPKKGYSLINPVLYTEVPESLSYPKYNSLKGALTQYVRDTESSGSANKISIYYRDLDAGQWVGVNATEKYNPGSMLKVVTLIGLLQASESNPAILADRVQVPSTMSIPTAGGQSYYPPNDPVQSGVAYSIQDLMQRMIIQSDNGANALVTAFLGDAITNTNYANLHINLPSKGTVAEVSPEEYSHLFRILYNSSYLNTADSEKALQLLSQTTFTAGLVAGVPNGTVVAHKFGEVFYPSTGTLDQKETTAGLNDCGIIYYPNHPYFLCVMTKGKDFPTLAGVIRDVSSITWKNVQSVYPN